MVGVLNVAVSFVVFQACYAYVALGGVLARTVAAFAAEDPLRATSADAALATAVGYLAGVVNSFLLNRAWTFKVRTRAASRFVRFLALSLLGLSCSSLAMYALVDVHGYSPVAIWLLITGLVMALNFVGSKYWAFAVEGDGG